MKHILCYGDSNTWGSMAFGGRYDDAVQWPQLLGAGLQKSGLSYKVIQEGLCARTAGTTEKGSSTYLNGQVAFEAIYRSAMPLDYLVIALGTNDLKSKYKRTAQQIFDDILWYAQKAHAIQKEQGGDVRVVILAPANFISKKDYFYAEISKLEELQELFMECNYHYIMVSDLEITEDGVHYTKSDHQRVAKVVTQKIKELES
jgi:lysophospholipase L1-like esterase